MDWLLSRLRGLSTSSWSMAASCGDSYVTGNTGGVGAAIGRTTCLSPAAEDIHTVCISMSMFHQWMEILISQRGEMEWGHQSFSYLCKCSMFSICDDICGQSHGSLDLRNRHAAAASSVLLTIISLLLKSGITFMHVKKLAQYPLSPPH